ncbi:MAG: glycine cleavage system aminomethyltransferase GcvT [Kiritimatiellaeota bacterium]|nr:glycine cleavage system aminomethyltransferase GcvT [Kiritimatiellota bacterium]
MRRTVLHDEHIALGARMAPFGGFEMPIQYTGILAEHHAVRSAAAVFDVCHMGEFRIQGETALADLENLLSCDVASLEPGRCRYGFLCTEDGGVLDDQIVYRLGTDEFMMVVNAGTQDRDFAWICEHLSPASRALNVSAETAKLDLQGPSSVRILNRLLDEPIEALRYFHFRQAMFEREPILVSRTGYTGEIGFELYCSADLAPRLWRACLESDAAPAGLGARDTLRLEMGYPLHGHELSRERNAAEAGMDWALSRSKTFIGATAVRTPDAVKERLVGLVLEGRRSARSGQVVIDATGVPVGRVTSGSFAPSLKVAVAMAYVRTDLTGPGQVLGIDAGRHRLTARVTETPFYRLGSARRPFREFLV